MKILYRAALGDNGGRSTFRSFLRFGHFLQLGGSKWTEVVLYEQGVPLGRSGHPTCLYSNQNLNRPTMGPQNWRNWGQIALLGPLRLKCRSNTSMWAHLTSQPAEGLWNGWGSLGSLGSHLCCPGPLWNLKGVFWSFFMWDPDFCHWTLREAII